MIFNSDFLKQRRSGLKTDVNEAAIANAMANKKDNFSGGDLSQKGETPRGKNELNAISISNIYYLLDEVTRLLRDHQQNRELIRRLGKRYYQVVYPIQVNTLNHHLVV